MPPPSELPPALRGRPFSVAEALALGVSSMRLRAGDLRAPHRGVRVPRSLERTLALDCACSALVLPPGAAFSGTTAVALLGLPEPWAPGPSPPGPEDGGAAPGWLVEAAVPRGLVRPRINGVAVRPAGLVPGTPLVQRGGLPVLHPADAWAQRCVDLPLEDAVALGDAVRRRLRNGAVLAGAAARLPDPRGRSRAGGVLQLVRFAVDSPAETRLRLAVVRAGLPEPACGEAVPAGDHPVAWPDLGWPQALVAAEVDGLTHLDPRQRHLDLQRQRLLEELGWVVVVFSTREVWQHPEACTARLRARLLDRWPR